MHQRARVTQVMSLARNMAIDFIAKSSSSEKRFGQDEVWKKKLTAYYLFTTFGEDLKDIAAWFPRRRIAKDILAVVGDYNLLLQLGDRALLTRHSQWREETTPERSSTLTVADVTRTTATHLAPPSPVTSAESAESEPQTSLDSIFANRRLPSSRKLVRQIERKASRMSFVELASWARNRSRKRRSARLALRIATSGVMAKPRAITVGDNDLRRLQARLKLSDLICAHLHKLLADRSRLKLLPDDEPASMAGHRQTHKIHKARHLPLSAGSSRSNTEETVTANGNETQQSVAVSTPFAVDRLPGSKNIFMSAGGLSSQVSRPKQPEMVPEVAILRARQISLRQELALMRQAEAIFLGGEPKPIFHGQVSKPERTEHRMLLIAIRRFQDSPKSQRQKYKVMLAELQELETREDDLVRQSRENDSTRPEATQQTKAPSALRAFPAANVKEVKNFELKDKALPDAAKQSEAAKWFSQMFGRK
jgi:hypothetical protein